MKHILNVSAKVIAGMFLFASCLHAQGPGPMRGMGQGPLRGPAGERIEQFKKLRMMESLKFDEETSIRFFARYNKHQEEMRDIGEQRNDLMSQLRTLRRSNASNTELEKVVEELKGVQDRTGHARHKYVDDLKQILTIKQIADYFIFEENFVQNLREIMRDMQQERKDRRW